MSTHLEPASTFSPHGDTHARPNEGEDFPCGLKASAIVAVCPYDEPTCAECAAWIAELRRAAGEFGREAA